MTIICELAKKTKTLMREKGKAPYSRIKVNCDHCVDGKCKYEGKCWFKTHRI